MPDDYDMPLEEGTDEFSPKKGALHDDDELNDELLDDDVDPLFMGLGEDDDIFAHPGFGGEDNY